MSQQGNSNRTLIIIGLLLALGLPFCHLGDIGKTWSHLGPLWGGEVLWWALFVLVLLYVLFVERRPLSSIGFKAPGVLTILLGVVSAVVIVAGIGAIFSVVLPLFHLHLTQRIAGLFATPFLYRVAIVTRAAFVEEALFRGYGFERISELTGSTAIAALVTLALFTFAHYSGGGLAQVIIAGGAGVVLTILYMWRRNLWANILCHWLTDGAGFLLMPMMPHH